MLFFGSFLPEVVEEESQCCEAKNLEACSQEGADGQEVDREIALEYHSEEEGDEAQNVDDKQYCCASKSDKCGFL